MRNKAFFFTFTDYCCVIIIIANNKHEPYKNKNREDIYIYNNNNDNEPLPLNIHIIKTDVRVGYLFNNMGDFYNTNETIFWY